MATANPNPSRRRAAALPGSLFSPTWSRAVRRPGASGIRAGVIITSRLLAVVACLAAATLCGCEGSKGPAPPPKPAPVELPPPPPERASPAAVYGDARQALIQGDMARFIRCFQPQDQRKQALVVSIAPMMSITDLRRKGEGEAQDRATDLDRRFAEICAKYQIRLYDEASEKGWISMLGDVDGSARRLMPPTADVPGFFAAVIAFIDDLPRAPGDERPRASVQLRREYVGTLGKVALDGDRATAQAVLEHPGEQTHRPLVFRRDGNQWFLALD